MLQKNMDRKQALFEKVDVLVLIWLKLDLAGNMGEIDLSSDYW
jgi:hypothetical protein